MLTRFGNYLTEIVTIQLLCHFRNEEKQDMEKNIVNLINHGMFASI